MLLIMEPKQLIFKFGQMCRSKHDLWPQKERRNHLEKSISSVRVEHEIERCPFETCPKIYIEGPSRTRKFPTARKVEEMKRLIQFQVVFKRKVKASLFSPFLYADVIFRAGRNRNIIHGNVRKMCKSHM